jgi:hypothetical protein
MSTCITKYYLLLVDLFYYFFWFFYRRVLLFWYRNIYHASFPFWARSQLKVANIRLLASPCVCLSVTLSDRMYKTFFWYDATPGNIKQERVRRSLCMRRSHQNLTAQQIKYQSTIYGEYIVVLRVWWVPCLSRTGYFFIHLVPLAVLAIYIYVVSWLWDLTKILNKDKLLKLSF